MGVLVGCGVLIGEEVEVPVGTSVLLGLGVHVGTPDAITSGAAVWTRSGTDGLSEMLN